MRKLLLFASALVAISPTSALAENWVTIQSAAGLTTMYDADSVYVQTSTGLIYLASCDDEKCEAGNATQHTSQERYDCAARTVAFNNDGRGWGMPNRQASNEYLAGDSEYLPGTSVAITLAAVCAKKDSWPRRSN